MSRRRRVDCEQMRLELDAFDAPEATTPEDEAPVSAFGEEAQIDAGGLGEERPLDGPNMRELLGDQTFSEISRAVGATLGRALWRQLQEADPV